MDPALVNIWDEPIVQETPKRNNDANGDDDESHRPAKRARQTLFLADSDDEELEPGTSDRVVHRAPPAQNLDIDALFEGFDDDDDLSRPILDEEELTRQAKASYKAKMPPLTPHEIMPSSSPPPDTGGPSGKKGKDGKDKDEKKARRRIVKLDENRLLSEDGFPQLVKMTKEFKIKGKGHEAIDLDRLLQRYQYWTHQLYPKTTFSDTVDRIEKLCHSRRMNVSLSVWRDEAHGRGKPPDPEDDNDEETNRNGEDDAMDTDDPNKGLPPSSPPRSSSQASSPSRPNDNRDAAPARQPQQQQAPANDGFDDDDEDFWKNIDAGMEGALSDAPPPAPSSGPNSSMDEDEDMWDLVNEIEQETSANPKALPIAQGPAPQNQPAEDDWDDMYA